MEKQLQVEFNIPPAWRMIDEVRDKIATQTIIKDDEDLLLATTMATSELLENAVKYGYHEEGSDPVTLKLRITDDAIIIKVWNSVKETHNLNVLTEIVAKLAFHDPAELYNQRLLEIAVDPEGDHGRLGLYRIAYEGNFSLSHERNTDSVVITAIREL